MTTLFGHLNEFRPGTARLSVYLEQFELYCKANSILNSKKVSLFLTVIGGQVYTLLFDLFAPDSLATKDYAAFVEKLKSHFDCKPTNVVADCYTFHQKNQGPNESIAEYVAELRCLASPCTFGTFLEQVLRDGVVLGMRSESIQKWLLTEKEPTFSGVMEIALSSEATQKSEHTLHSSEAPQLLKVD